MIDINQVKKEMQKVINHLEEEFRHLQIGKASTGLVENIDVFVPSYGMNQKINQLANISILDSQTIKIEPWDKSTISAIEKTIRESDLGLNPLNQWDYLLIKIPPLTEERRKQLTKIIDKMWEESKIALRNIRHERRNKIKNLYENEEISEDEKKNLEKQLDEIIKDFQNQINKMCEAKKEEILEI